MSADRKLWLRACCCCFFFRRRKSVVVAQPLCSEWQNRNVWQTRRLPRTRAEIFPKHQVMPSRRKCQTVANLPNSILLEVNAWKLARNCFPSPRLARKTKKKKRKWWPSFQGERRKIPLRTKIFTQTLRVSISRHLFTRKKHLIERRKLKSFFFFFFVVVARKIVCVDGRRKEFWVKPSTMFDGW